MSEQIIKELQEAGITVNGKPLEKLPDILYGCGYAYARAHGLSIKDAHQIAMESLEPPTINSQQLRRSEK